jgi:uncharacterized RDD family membrane protein YckC
VSATVEPERVGDTVGPEGVGDTVGPEGVGDTVEPERRIHVDVIPAEARALQGRRAGLVSRILANLLDLGVVFTAVIATYVGWAGIKLLWQGSSFTRPTPGFAAALLFSEVLTILYFTAAWTTSGRTVGNRVMGLRVVGRSDRPLSVGMALGRAVLCVLVPFGLLWAGVSRENRSVQDLILRTSVIYDWAPRTRERF